MEFLTLEVGGPDTDFGESGPPVTVPFRFSRPHQTALSLIQGFDFAFDAPDNELEKINISPTVHFGAGDRSGTVEVHFSMVGDEITWPWVFPSNLITAHIKLLIIGTDLVPNKQILFRDSTESAA